MSGSYWKMIGERVARGLGEKTVSRLGKSGRFLGRAGAVVGAGVLFYELFKNYKENIEKEPAYQEMAILQEEMAKWTNALSCLGSEPYDDKKYGSLFEGGAINALYDKKSLEGEKVRPADPEEAADLIGRAVDYILKAENLGEDEGFEERRKALVSRLKRLRTRLGRAGDFGKVQRELAEIVDEIKPVVSGYSSRIYDCSMEIQKTLGSNAAWAALSMTTLGIVKKPEA